MFNHRTNGKTKLYINYTLHIFYNDENCVSKHNCDDDLPPLYVIFRLLFNQANSLEDICDVVNASFLYCQHISSIVQIKNTIRRCPNKANKLFGQNSKRGIIASLFQWGGGSYYKQKIKKGVSSKYTCICLIEQ